MSRKAASGFMANINSWSERIVISILGDAAYPSFSDISGNHENPSSTIWYERIVRLQLGFPRCHLPDTAGHELCSVLTRLTHTCSWFTHTCRISGDHWQVGSLILSEERPRWRKAGSTHEEKKKAFISKPDPFSGIHHSQFKDADDRIPKKC